MRLRRGAAAAVWWAWSTAARAAGVMAAQARVRSGARLRLRTAAHGSEQGAAAAARLAGERRRVVAARGRLEVKAAA